MKFTKYWGRFVIQNWMKTRFSVEFLWLWETINNNNFNRIEFDTVKNESWTNAFIPLVLF